MWAAKRFYREVSVSEGEAGFSVTLDAHVLKTPKGKPLAVTSRPLAEAIAEEWAAQEEGIRPDTMPLFQLAATAADRVGDDRETIVDGIVAYAQTDLLCYRAEAPSDLVERQQAVWQPLLEWMFRTHGVVFSVTTGVMPVSLPVEVEPRLRRVFEACDDFELAAMSSMTAACGSVVLAMALAGGHIGADEAFAAAQLDETYQAEQWGMDAEALARRERLRKEIIAAHRFLALAGERSEALSPVKVN
jgi:chaperone required for assembly of F1-ATPase